MCTTTVTSLEGFRETPTARRTDELVDEQRQFLFGDRRVPTSHPGQVCGWGSIVGPDGERLVSLATASTPLRSSKD